jgi:hypothetical protein
MDSPENWKGLSPVGQPPCDLSTPPPLRLPHPPLLPIPYLSDPPQGPLAFRVGAFTTGFVQFVLWPTCGVVTASEVRTAAAGQERGAAGSRQRPGPRACISAAAAATTAARNLANLGAHLNQGRAARRG